MYKMSFFYWNYETNSKTHVYTLKQRLYVWLIFLLILRAQVQSIWMPEGKILKVFVIASTVL